MNRDSVVKGLREKYPDVIADFHKGMTEKEIAIKYYKSYLSMKYLTKALLLAGLIPDTQDSRGGKHKYVKFEDRKEIPEVIKDWNEGKPGQYIMEKNNYTRHELDNVLTTLKRLGIISSRTKETVTYSKDNDPNFIKDWNSGISILEICRNYKISTFVCRMIIKRLVAEGLISKRNNTTRNQAGLIRDWNSGLDTKTITLRYGFSSTKSLFSCLRRLREKGFDLIKRRDFINPEQTNKTEKLIADWNSGIPSKELAKKYNYSSIKGVRNQISILRKRGHEIKYRSSVMR